MEKKPVTELTDDEIRHFAELIQERARNRFAGGGFPTGYDEAEEAQIMERFAALQA